jgi:hypothetical protein
MTAGRIANFLKIGNYIHADENSLVAQPAMVGAYVA